MNISKNSWHYKFLEKTLVEVPQTLFMYVWMLIAISISIITAIVAPNLIAFAIGLWIINTIAISILASISPIIFIVIGWIAMLLLYLIYRTIRNTFELSTLLNKQLHFRE